ncbi:BTB/POZ domain [Trinorchestia longiramus]|nr:BTB/POZ domain [Trinorchestia longiramus]
MFTFENGGTPKVVTPKMLTSKVVTPKMLTSKVLCPTVLCSKVVTPKVVTAKEVTPKVVTPIVLCLKVVTPKEATPKVSDWCPNKIKLFEFIGAIGVGGAKRPIFLAMVEQHFCLRWNNYRTNITAEFEVLREGEHFVDVTLACDGQQLKAHKVVLSACSPYFKDLLQGNPCSHPIIILRDVGYVHMRGLLEFMYAGEVNVSQAQLAAFLRTAEALKVRGLAEAPAPQQQQQPSSVHQVAAAAAAAAAVTNSVVDLLALNSSIGSLPLVPLSSHMPLGGVSHASALDSKQSNSSYSRPPAGLSCSAESHSKCEDDQVESEPLPLTVNSETKVKERCSPPPPSLRCSKRVKYSGSREGSPESPSHSSYYPTNTPSNGSAATVGPESHDDADGGELVHDLSSNSRKRQLSGPHKDSSRNVSSNANGGDSNSGGTHGGASRPPSLAPSPPQHLQYVFKNEPADPCGGSDTEGGCGGGWLEDNSVGSDGEMLVGGHDPSGGSTVGDHGKNGGSVSSSLMLPSLHPSASGAGPPSSSRGHPLQHSSSSPPLPLQQQPQQQQHVLHRAMPPQESHLAGYPDDVRLIRYPDYRGPSYRGLTVYGSKRRPSFCTYDSPDKEFLRHFSDILLWVSFNNCYQMSIAKREWPSSTFFILKALITWTKFLKPSSYCPITCEPTPYALFIMAAVREALRPIMNSSEKNSGLFDVLQHLFSGLVAASADFFPKTVAGYRGY